jgi:hypothetical protein
MWSSADNIGHALGGDGFVEVISFVWDGRIGPVTHG